MKLRFHLSKKILGYRLLLLMPFIPSQGARIGRVRRDLAALEIKRALIAPGVDVDNLRP